MTMRSMIHPMGRPSSFFFFFVFKCLEHLWKITFKSSILDAGTDTIYFINVSYWFDATLFPSVLSCLTRHYSRVCYHVWSDNILVSYHAYRCSINSLSLSLLHTQMLRLWSWMMLLVLSAGLATGKLIREIDSRVH